MLAMLLLSQSYEDLGLHMAARYYAAGALFTAIHVKNDAHLTARQPGGVSCC